MTKKIGFNELHVSCTCKARRAFPMQVKDTSIGNHFLRAVIAKSILREVGIGSMAVSDIEPEAQRRFAELNFPSEEQRRIQARDCAKELERYCSCETRTPILVTPEDVILSPDTTVRVSPDRIFVDGDTLEVVMFKTSKPKITQKKAGTDLGLYTMVQYGKARVEAAMCKYVKASYYYLSKKNDNLADTPAKPSNFDTDFFKIRGGNNIVSLTDEIDPTGAPTDLDLAFRPLIADFEEGLEKEECKQSDCDICPLEAICHYSEPPIAQVKEHATKSISSISLTDAQREALEYTKGVACLNSGAGTGKTLTMVLCVITLLMKGVLPEEICMITFSKSGADEMRERIALYGEDFGMDADLSKITIQTFNAFGDTIVRDNYKKLGFSEEPKVIDDIERSHIIAEILHDALAKAPDDSALHDLNWRNFISYNPNIASALGSVKAIFDKMKSQGLSAADVPKIMSGLSGGLCYETVYEVALLYDRYDELLRENNLIEFADQQQMVMELLHDEPYFFEQFGFKHIIVDEYQDTDEIQFTMLKLLYECPTCESLMAVGDDSQNIYEFRGTDPDFLINFDQHMGLVSTKMFLLENHRSTPEIIEFANKVNDRIHSRVIKDLIATRPHGKPVEVEGFFTPQEEREWVADEIRKKIDAGAKAEDIAIICYDKNELAQMADALSEKSIPSILKCPQKLSENSRVKAAIALVHALRNTEDSKGVLIYTNALIGGGIMDMSAAEISAEMMKVQNMLMDYHELPNDTKKKEKLMEMLKAIDHNDDEIYNHGFLETLERKSLKKLFEYVEDFELYGQALTYHPNRNYPGVVLTTAHSSKGLEWPIVYNMISKYHTKRIGLRPADDRRRVLFVSATRARDELYITGQYVAFGQKGDYTYNRFLVETFADCNKEFSVSTIESERLMRKQLKDQQEKEAKAKAEAEAKEMLASV